MHNERSARDREGVDAELRAHTVTQGLPLTAQAVKNPPEIQETQVMQFQSLGQEVPLKEEMATHSSVLAWTIPRTEEPVGLQFIGFQRVRHN